MAMPTVLIIGATSAIAQETARLFAAKDGAAFVLVGRDAARLETVSADLLARGASRAEIWAGNLTDPEAPSRALAQAGAWDLLLIAHGSLSDEERAASDSVYRDQEIAINLTSVMAFAYAGAADLKRRGIAGQIAIVTSVAGLRGRAKNFFYGSAKAALIAFCQGLRARAADGIAVTELRPGMIDTPMTAGMKKGLLMASRETAGRLGYEAIKARKATAYIPGYWRVIMTIIRLIPEPIFQRMKF